MQGTEFMHTIEEVLAQQTDKETREGFMEDLAQNLASRCLELADGIRVMSLDIRSRNELTEDAKNSYPEDMQYTRFYQHALDFKEHVQGNVFNLPFLSGSISLITSIEGYPANFSGLPLSSVEPAPGHMDFAQEIIRVLKPGGRAVFFPWMTYDNSMGDIQKLKQVRDFWNRRGIKTKSEYHYVGDLQETMGERERNLMFVSPLFKKFRYRISALTLEKPAA